MGLHQVEASIEREGDRDIDVSGKIDVGEQVREEGIGFAGDDRIYVGR